MSYPGHNVTRPRSVLVIVGGMIAWVGLCTGALITTPEYHRRDDHEGRTRRDDVAGVG